MKRVKKEARRRELEAWARVEQSRRRGTDRDLPTTLPRLRLRHINRGPRDADYPYDPYRTPVIRRPDDIGRDMMLIQPLPTAPSVLTRCTRTRQTCPLAPACLRTASDSSRDADLYDECEPFGAANYLVELPR